MNIVSYDGSGNNSAEEVLNEIFPEIVKARSVNDRSGPCPCFVLKDEAAVISRACAYVDDTEKEV